MIQGSETTRTSKNPIAVMNLTVLGGFFLPGSQCDSLFTMQAGLVDVNNGCLYMSLESEGEARIYRPTFIIEEKDAIEKSKSLAVKQFASQLVNRVRGLRDSVAKGEPSLVDSIGPVQEVDPKTRQPTGK